MIVHISEWRGESERSRQNETWLKKFIQRQELMLLHTFIAKICQLKFLLNHILVNYKIVHKFFKMENIKYKSKIMWRDEFREIVSKMVFMLYFYIWIFHFSHFEKETYYNSFWAN